ncbi:hypothetical protein Goari_018078 [Gossypium aridum]|uniref:Uncharacterized protein n=1 Tax=Gossypium aridum TaxID=34290 RepID=A0A7J8WP11_GOSAI|nr:hypothetical protein [Gossypium aridum]
MNVYVAGLILPKMIRM